MHLAEHALSKTQWAEPEVDWLPLSQAVFKFGVAEDGIANDLIEKPLHELAQAEKAEDGTTPFSVGQLTEILERKSGARAAEINLTSSTFSFSFDFHGGASSMGGPPWAIIEVPKKTAAGFDPRIDAEALFNTEGFVRIDDEEAVEHAKQLDDVRKATSLVWHQYMLRAFDRAVSAGAIVLFARKHAVSAHFERLPKDVWPLLEIVDWQNGVAVAPERTVYWSIHVQRSTVGVKSSSGKRGRNRKVDWDGVVKRQVFELLDHHGWPDRSDPEWSSQADVEATVSTICGVPLSESTVRHYTARFMAEWKRAKAGK
jgi:hypothetical protein